METLETRRLLAADPEVFGFNSLERTGTDPLLAIQIDFSDTDFDERQTEEYYRSVLFGGFPSASGYFRSQGPYRFNSADDGGTFEDGILSVTFLDDPETSVDESIYAVSRVPGGPDGNTILYANFQSPNYRNFVQARNGGGESIGADYVRANDDGGRLPTSRVWENFKIIDINGGNLEYGDTIRIKNPDGSYWTINGDKLDGTATHFADAEIFTIESANGQVGPIDGRSSDIPIRFRTNDFRYLRDQDRVVGRPTVELFLTNSGSGPETIFELEPTAISDGAFLGKAIEFAGVAGFNFNTFDVDGSGTIDLTEELQVLVIDASPGSNNGGSVRGITSVPFGSRSISGRVASVGRNASFSTITHELSHLLGTDDLYGATCNSSHLTLMGCTIYGSDNQDDLSTEQIEAWLYGLDPWHRMRLGWLEPQVIDLAELEASGTTIVPDLNRPILVYDSTRGVDEYYILEQRPDNLAGRYDQFVGASRSNSPGVAVWYVKTDSSFRSTQIPSLTVSDGMDGSVFALGHNRTFVGDPNDPKSRGALIELEPSRGLVTPAERLWREGSYRLRWLDPDPTDSIPAEDTGAGFTINDLRNGKFDVRISPNPNPTFGGDPIISRFRGTHLDDTWYVFTADDFLYVYGLDDRYDPDARTLSLPLPSVPLYKVSLADFGTKDLIFHGDAGTDRLILSQRNNQLLPGGGKIHFFGSENATLEVVDRGTVEYTLTDTEILSDSPISTLITYENVGTLAISGANSNDVITVNASEPIPSSVVINGYSGFDVIDAREFPQGVTINGGVGQKTITGTAFDDRIFSGDTVNIIDGGLGDDLYQMVLGQPGRELEHGYANAIADPGGRDHLSFETNTFGVNVDLAQNRGESQVLKETSSSFYPYRLRINGKLEYLTGSQQADVLSGSSGSEWIEGLGGMDVVSGGPSGRDDVITQGKILTVTSDLVGAGSLPAMVAKANDEFPEEDAIVFDESVWGATIGGRSRESNRMTITQALQIIGPPLRTDGQPQFTIDRVNDAGAIFNIDDPAAPGAPSFDVSIKNLALVRNSTDLPARTFQRPGFIDTNANTHLSNLFIQGDKDYFESGISIEGTPNVEIQNVHITDVTGYEGAVSIRADHRDGAKIGIMDSLIESNIVIADSFGDVAPGAGVNIKSFSGGSTNTADVWIERSTIRDNLSEGQGGGVGAFGDGTMVIKDSLISENVAQQDGAGIFRELGDTAVVNSTLSFNVAGGNGGGATFVSGNATLINNTITLNGADVEAINSSPSVIGAGGGISSLAALVTTHNTLIAGNFKETLGNPSDVAGALASLSTHNLIADANSAGGLVNGSSGNIVGVGGIGTRSLDTILHRSRDDNGGPTRTHALVVPGPAVDAGSTVVATVTLPDGTTITPMWDQRGEPFRRHVHSTLGLVGNPDIGAYEHQSTFIVDVPRDDLLEGVDIPGTTLREAVEAANRNPGTDRIQFDPVITDTPITLGEGGGAISISAPVSIEGLGPDELEVFAPDGDRIFNIDVPLGSVSISDLTLSDGQTADNGGAILTDTALTLRNIRAIGNRSEKDGGAIYVMPGSSLELYDSDIEGNQAGMMLNGPSIDPFSGGAIFVGNAGTLRVVNSTLENNDANGSGGAIGADTPVDRIGIVNSSLLSNHAVGDGGAVYSGFGEIHISNSTISGNLSGSQGGGIAANVGSVVLRSSTIALNEAAVKGAGVLATTDGKTLLHNTILAGNRSAVSNHDPIAGPVDAGSSHNLLDTSDLAVTGGIADGNNGNIAGPKGGGVLALESILDPFTFSVGGSSPAHSLVLDSPAIDAGNDLEALDDEGKVLGEDQRGGQYPRKIGAAIDIGASEFGSGPTSLIAGRLQYENSMFDGESDMSKRPLVAGETATFANYTGNVGGITSVIVDVLNPSSDLVITDFQFRKGNSQNPGQWSLWAEPSEFDVEKLGGVGGADRVTLKWKEEDAIKNGWLSVSVLATKNTGLTEPVTHYWGNQIGETGNSPGDTRVNALDVGLVVNNNTGFVLASVDNAYDLNKDGRVNALDVGVIVNNNTAFTSLILLSLPESFEKSGKEPSGNVLESINSLNSIETLKSQARSQTFDTLATPTMQLLQQSLDARDLSDQQPTELDFTNREVCYPAEKRNAIQLMNQGRLEETLTEDDDSFDNYAFIDALHESEEDWFEDAIDAYWVLREDGT